MNNGSVARARSRAIATFALACIAALTAQSNAAELESPYAENWLFYQRNTNGSIQWKDEPRIYIPWRFDNGWTFTQRTDLPLIYTNNTGPGKPNDGYSFGLGDAFIEEIFDSPEIAPDLRVKASIRFVFPTGRQKPFGSSQYQWAPAAGIAWKARQWCDCVTLAPFVRWFSGFSPQYDNVQDVRKLDIYPAADIAFGDDWSFELYPENPIVYNAANRTWFVPIDVMVAKRVDRNFDFGIGGAFRVGNSPDPSFRYILNGRIVVHF